MHVTILYGVNALDVMGLPLIRGQKKRLNLTKRLLTTKNKKNKQLVETKSHFLSAHVNPFTCCFNKLSMKEKD